MAAMVGRDDMGAGRQRRDDPVPQPRVKTRRVEQEQRSALPRFAPFEPADIAFGRGQPMFARRGAHTQPFGPSISRMRSSLSCWSVTGARSEEHTSELQSLMRISYAVFCL